MSSTTNKYAFGMIGLGTMGRSLLLNMADHGYAVAGLDQDKSKVAALNDEGKDKDIKGFDDAREFVQSLTKPRAIMMLVPAGQIVDSVIAEMTPLLDKGDILI